ncbi:MAG: Dipeptide transport system permease protein DppB, partial [uncultured Thermomicrobiales bacterium]
APLRRRPAAPGRGGDLPRQLRHLWDHAARAREPDRPPDRRGGPGQPGPDRRHRAEVGARPALAPPVPDLAGQRRPGRLRPLRAPHRHARVGHAPRGGPDHPAAQRPGPAPLDRDRRAGRDPRRDPALLALRLREHAAGDARRRVARLLGGADGNPPLLAGARLGAPLRHPGLAGLPPARGGPCLSGDGHPRPPHPRRHVRGPVPGLRQHRPGQGAHRPRGPRPAHRPQRPAPDRHRARLPARLYPQWHDRGRDDLRLGRARRAVHRLGAQPRLPGRPGDRPAPGDRCRGRQPADRPRLRGDRPADPAQV